MFKAAKTAVVRTKEFPRLAGGREAGRPQLGAASAELGHNSDVYSACGDPSGSVASFAGDVCSA